MTDLANAIRSDSEVTGTPDPSEEVSTLMALAEEMEHLKEIIIIEEAQLKDFRQRFDEVRKKLIPDEMVAVGLVSDAGKGSFTLRSGAKVHLQGDVYAHYLKAAEVGVFAWLRAQGHGALIKETVHPATLKAFAKEQLAEGVTLPEDLFQVSPFTYAKLVRRKT